MMPATPAAAGEPVPGVIAVLTAADAAAQRTALGVPAGSGNSTGTNTGDQTSVTGNAGTATALQTARNINGVAFDGTANITINAVDSTARVAKAGDTLTGRELHAVYPFLSITHNTRVRVEVSVPDGDAHIPSIVAVYPANDWHERETYDFFGIVFDGHPALTRIMMPDDWPGHPQRKDYPLGGIPVEYKGAEVPPPDQRRAYT